MERVLEKDVYRQPQLSYPMSMAYPYNLPYLPQAPQHMSPYQQYPYQPIQVHRPIAQLPIFSQMMMPTPLSRQATDSTKTMPLPSQTLSLTDGSKPKTISPPKETKEEPKEESKSGNESEKKTSNGKPTSGGAYKRRNVYKSIIRHMYSYVRKNRDDIIKVLLAAKYLMSEIEHAFFEVSFYNDTEQEKGNRRQSQSTIKKMIDQRSIYTYILRETLNAMIRNWNEGKHGKVSSKNLGTYRDVCIAYYNEAAKVLEQEAQGKSHKL